MMTLSLYKGRVGSPVEREVADRELTTTLRVATGVEMRPVAMPLRVGPRRVVPSHRSRCVGVEGLSGAYRPAGNTLNSRRRQSAGESTKQAEKTIACGMPDESGATVVTEAGVFKLTFTHQAAGASCVRRSARPLFWAKGLIARGVCPVRARQDRASPRRHNNRGDVARRYSAIMPLHRASAARC